MDLTVTGDLVVDGTSTLDGMITCRSDSFFTGFLRVGALAGVGFNVLEIAQVNQGLTVGGDATLSGEVTVGGSAAVTGNLTVSGANGLFVEGPVVVDDLIRTNAPHGIVCGGELAVAQDATLQETLTVLGDVTLSQSLAVGLGISQPRNAQAQLGMLTALQLVLRPSVFTTLGESVSGAVVIFGINNPAQSFAAQLPDSPLDGTNFSFVIASRSGSSTYTIQVDGAGSDKLEFTTEGGTLRTGVTSAFSNATGATLHLVYAAGTGTWFGTRQAVGFQ